MICKYKDIFGKPGEGAHASRYLGVATVDLAATVGVAVVIAGIAAAVKKPKPGQRKKIVKSFISIFVIATIVLMLIAIVLHRLFCVDTALNVKIFGNVNPVSGGDAGLCDDLSNICDTAGDDDLESTSCDNAGDDDDSNICSCQS